MRVLILHHAVSDEDSIADRDVLVQRDEVIRGLDALGHEHQTLTCTLDLAALAARLDAIRPEVVFNLVESLGGSDRLAPWAAALLDVKRIPYTGSSAEAILATTHKIRAKRAMHREGLPTPAWLEGPEPAARSTGIGPASWTGPRRFVLKTVFEHASFALDDACLVEAGDPDALRRFLAAHQQKCGRRCFAEEFVDGREFNVAMLAGGDGPSTLPAAEIDFSGYPEGKPRIVGQTAKWDADSFEFQNTPPSFAAARVEPELCGRLAELGRRCWESFELGGYVRVDFRVDAQGRPWILEVNANPCLSPDAGYAAALDEAGIPWEAAIARILADARHG